MTFKSGFVAILGRPNVGKSTFLNHVMGQKIAIMSDKAQTTRNKIMGIYTTDKELSQVSLTTMAPRSLVTMSVCSKPILAVLALRPVAYRTASNV